MSSTFYRFLPKSFDNLENKIIANIRLDIFFISLLFDIDDFKPASVDLSKVATLDVSSNNQVTVTVPHLGECYFKSFVNKIAIMSITSFNTVSPFVVVVNVGQHPILLCNFN